DMDPEAGWIAVVAAGFQAFLKGPWDEVKPLLDEMFECVKAMPDPSKPAIVRPLIEDDIEEIASRVKLRDEVFELHAGFSLAGALSSLGQSATLMTETFEDIQTSDETSGA